MIAQQPIMNKLSFLLNYLRYYFTADTKYDIHSPFVYKLVTEVFEDTNQYPTYLKIEAIRKQLLQDKNEITVEDFGAGANNSQPNNEVVKRINSIAKLSAKPAKYAQLLFRLAKYLQPQTLIELGTSLGISTLYQAAAMPLSCMITCEGSKNIAAIAQQNFNQLQLKNIEIVTGNFDFTLSEVLQRGKTVDWIFFDGNHRKEPTLRYFHAALSKVNEKTVFIFDDINWSNEMKEAWNEIKKHPAVTITIDLYMMGIVFFNTDFTKQQFTIRY